MLFRGRDHEQALASVDVLDVAFDIDIAKMKIVRNEEGKFLPQEVEIATALHLHYLIDIDGLSNSTHTDQRCGRIDSAVSCLQCFIQPFICILYASLVFELRCRSTVDEYIRSSAVGRRHHNHIFIFAANAVVGSSQCSLSQTFFMKGEIVVLDRGVALCEIQDKNLALKIERDDVGTAFLYEERCFQVQEIFAGQAGFISESLCEGCELDRVAGVFLSEINSVSEVDGINGRVDIYEVAHQKVAVDFSLKGVLEQAVHDRVVSAYSKHLLELRI